MSETASLLSSDGADVQPLTCTRSQQMPQLYSLIINVLCEEVHLGHLHILHQCGRTAGDPERLIGPLAVPETLGRKIKPKGGEALSAYRKWTSG